MNFKQCSACKLTKPVLEFYKNPTGKYGVGPTCKPCAKKTSALNKQKNPERTRELDRAWREKNREKIRADANRWTKENPDKRRKIFIKMKYGLIENQWDELFSKQGRVCALCKSPDPKSRWNAWHTDHKHGTKTVRGILCQPCNWSVGFFEKRILPILPQVMEYLNEKTSTCVNDPGFQCSPGTGSSTDFNSSRRLDLHVL